MVALDTPGLNEELGAFLGLPEETLRFTDPGVVFDLKGVRAQLHRLQPGEMERFNERTPDAPEVYYQSFAGVSYALGQPYLPETSVVRRDCNAVHQPLFSLVPEHRDAMSEVLLSTAAHASRYHVGDGETRSAAADGMVAVPSARWGVFRGCLPADHYDVAGQFRDLGPDPSTGFDARSFHLSLAMDLVKMEDR